jgi:hypothetical protein
LKSGNVVNPDNLASVVDPVGYDVIVSRGFIEGRVDAVLVDEAIGDVVAVVEIVLIISNDLTRVVDAGGKGGEARGIIEGGVRTPAVKEAVITDVDVAVVDAIVSDDLTRVIDPGGTGGGSQGFVLECGVGSVLVEEVVLLRHGMEARRAETPDVALAAPFTTARPRAARVAPRTTRGLIGDWWKGVDSPATIAQHLIA